MSINVYFVAEPPQMARLGAVNKLSAPYEVGDRITVDSGLTWVCTGAGIGDTYYFNGVTTWGTSTWAQQAAASWATAATGIQGGTAVAIAYVDYRCVPNTTVPANTVTIYVDPATMTPRESMFAGGPRNVFFGNPVKSYDNHDARPVLGGTGLASAASGGVNVRYAPEDVAWEVNGFGIDYAPLNAQTYLTLVGHGIGAVLPAGNVTTMAYRAGLMQDVRTAGTYTTRTIGITSAQYQRLYSASQPVVEYNQTDTLATAVPDIMSKFVPSLTNYRNGAAPPGQPNMAYQLYRAEYCSACMHWRTPMISRYNSLTGSRTIKVHVMTDSPCPLNDADMWIEVFYPASATTALVGTGSTMNANFGASYWHYTKVAIPIDPAAWTVTNVYGTTNYLLSKTVTISKAGLVRVRVICASSRINMNYVFVDPYFEIV